MPCWLLTFALIGAVGYLWGGTYFWAAFNLIHWGWDFAIYALLVAVPLIIIGVLATRAQHKNTNLAHRGWRLANRWLGLLLVWTLTLVMADYQSGDFQGSLLPWTTTYAEHGLLWSLRHFTEVSNYAAFYNYFLIILGQFHPTTFAALYAIKYLSFLASIATALAVALIVAHVRGKPLSWGLVIGCLLLPPVILDGALWSQCDAIYAAFCLFAFYAALKHRSKTCLVLVGLAFCIKFQFIFIVPVLFLMLIIKDADGRPYLRWRDIWLGPVMYMLNLLPVLVGAQFLPLLTVYFAQATYPYLTATCANFGMLWEFMLGVAHGFPASFIGDMLSSPTDVRWAPYQPTALYVVYYGAMLLGLIAFGMLLWAVLRRCLRQKPTAADWCYYALLFALTMPMVMPHMHERFLFLAVTLSIIYACIRPAPRNQVVAWLLIGSLTFILVWVEYRLSCFNWYTITTGTAWLHITLLLLAFVANLVAWFILLDGLNRRPVCRGRADS